MKEFPILNGKEIILRKLESDDFNDYYNYVTDEKIAKQFNFNYNEESAKKRLVELVEKYNQDDKPFIWVIALKSNNEFIGMITVDYISYLNKRFSLAYGIREKYRGYNYAYYASKILIDYIFNNLDMHRLEISHNIDNYASQKVIEKLGAKFEGIARESKYYDGQFKDRKIYSILKDEWVLSNKNEL